MDDLDFLTTKEVAERAGVTDSAVRRALASGRLEGVKRGGVWFIPRKDAQRWIDLPHSRGRKPRQLRLPEGGKDAS